MHRIVNRNNEKGLRILDYLAIHPDATQANIAFSLGYSRQIVYYTLKQHNIKARRKERIKGVPCIYCGEEVTTARWENGKRIQCTWHRSCWLKSKRNHIICPVCGSRFERIASQMRTTTDVHVCSPACRDEARKRGMYRSKNDTPASLRMESGATKAMAG